MTSKYNNFCRIMTNICVYIFWTKSYILKMKICLKEAKSLWFIQKKLSESG